MISSLVSRVSAAVLGVCGLALLFAPDVILPHVAPGFPPDAAWIGQLLGAAWIGMAALNWLNRGAMMGGIYARPVVFANATLYFISVLSLVRTAVRSGATTAVWGASLVFGIMTVIYGMLLFRGPLESELRAARG